MEDLKNLWSNLAQEIVKVKIRGGKSFGHRTIYLTNKNVTF